MSCVIGILGMSVERDISTSRSPIVCWLGRFPLKNFFDTIAMVEVDVDDDAFQLRVLTKRVGGGDNDVIEITVSAAKVGGGVMTRRSN
jgi:hypothetical protein